VVSVRLFCSGSVIQLVNVLLLHSFSSVLVRWLGLIVRFVFVCVSSLVRVAYG
jgi:hypothetical protein